MPDDLSGTQAEYRELPILDLGEFLAGSAGAVEALAVQLRHACEEIGFFFITNHGISDELISSIFAETKRFHDLPEGDKLALEINENQRGFITVSYTHLTLPTNREV